MDITRIGVGHNTGMDFDAIQARATELATAANQWLAAPEIADGETADLLDSLLAQIRAEIKAADEVRKGINAPYDQSIKANNGRFKPVTDLLDRATAVLKPLKVGWLVREGERIANERAAAERAALAALQAAEDAKVQASSGRDIMADMAAEQAEAAADQAMADLDTALAARARVKGELATSASGLRTYWSAEVTDWTAAALHYSSAPELREVIQKLANADARQMKADLRVIGIVAKSENRA